MNDSRMVAVRQVEQYITGKGLAVKSIENNDDGSVRIYIETSNIRSIDLKAYLEESGYQEYRIGYDAVDFFPDELDVYSFSGEILTEDPNLKLEEVKENLINEFEGVIKPEDINVSQKRGPKVAEGTNNFAFSVSTNSTCGQLAEKMYIDKMFPATSMSTLVGDMLKENKKKSFGVDEVKQQMEGLATYQLELLKEDLQKSLEVANRFAVKSTSQQIEARISVIDSVLATRPQEDDYEDDEDDYEPCYEDEDCDGEDFAEVDEHVGFVFNVVNLERDALENMSTQELEEIEMHLGRALESSGCLPVLKESISNCLALVKEIKEKA